MKTFLTAAVFALTILASNPALASSPICVGQVVYGDNGSSLVGIVTNVFNNGQIEVRWLTMNGQTYSGNLSYWPAYQLSVETNCSGTVCEGNTIYADNGNSLVGTARRVFSNGMVEVEWELMNGRAYHGNTTYWPAYQLSAIVGCSGQICGGDQVYGSNGNNLVGTAQRVFKNGTVEVLWSMLNGAPYNNNDFAYWPAYQLTKTSQPCTGGRCQ